MDVPEALALLLLGLLTPEGLPAVAMEALDAGADDPSLAQLAGLTPFDPREARDLFQQAVAMMRISEPPIRDAALIGARWIAREALGERRALSLACHQLWKLVVDWLWDDFCDDRLTPPLADLAFFVQLHDDLELYQDDPVLRPRIERDIRSELEYVLGDGPKAAHPWSADLEYRTGHGWAPKTNAS